MCVCVCVCVWCVWCVCVCVVYAMWCVCVCVCVCVWCVCGSYPFVKTLRKKEQHRPIKWQNWTQTITAIITAHKIHTLLNTKTEFKKWWHKEHEVNENGTGMYHLFWCSITQNLDYAVFINLDNYFRKRGTVCFLRGRSNISNSVYNRFDFFSLEILLGSLTYRQQPTSLINTSMVIATASMSF